MGVSANNKQLQNGESGFVLVTSIIMLGLLTLMSLGMYFVSKSGTQTSAAAQTSTQAYYFSETAVNYISWALANDAELDSYASYAGSYLAPIFDELPTDVSIGDWSELNAYRWYPGPTVISDSLLAGKRGQIRYLDNSPMGSRTICMESVASFANCIDVTLSPANVKRVSPRMHQISASLPRYIKLDIASNGTITPSIPALPHHTKPVVGQDIPLNGAIVWLVAVDSTNMDHDVEIFPLDPNSASIYPGTGTGITAPSDCGLAGNSCPCDYNVITPVAQACDANTGLWLSYNIAAYAIGYVNGKPSYLLRAVIR